MDASFEPPALDTLRAAVLAVVVHLLFFALLAFGLRWQKQEPAPLIAEVWSELPAAPPAAPASPKAPEPHLPEAPAATRAEAKAPPKAQTQKADIALKARPEPHKTEARKPEPPPPAPTPKPAAPPRAAPETPDRDILLQRQLAMIQQQQAQAEAARAAAQNEKVLGDYRGRIIRKIQGFLNRQPCGEGDPLVEFDVTLLPTGQLRGSPVLKRSSGLPACDRAVEYAIVQADPLPVPTEPEQFRLMRELHLKICPNNPNPQCTRP